jgi:hypothetical protein
MSTFELETTFDGAIRLLSDDEVAAVSGGRGCIYNPLTDGNFEDWVREENDWLPGGRERLLPSPV